MTTFSFIPSRIFPTLFTKATVSLGPNNFEYTAHYNYRAILENLLNYSGDVKKTSLAISKGWYEDAIRGVNCAATVVHNEDTTKPHKRSVMGSKAMTSYMRPQLSVFGQ